MGQTTATGLRRNLYTVLDKVESTGQPAYVTRRGRLFQIRLMPARAEGVAIDELPELPHLVRGDAADLPDVHWSVAHWDDEPSEP